MRIFTTTALTVLLATPAFAEGLEYYGVTIDALSFLDDGEDITFSGIQAQVDYDYGMFMLATGVGRDVINDSFGTDLSFRQIYTSVGFELIEGSLIGAGVERRKILDSGALNDRILWEYFAQYDTETFGVAAVNRSVSDFGGDYEETFYYARANVADMVEVNVEVGNNTFLDGNSYAVSAEAEFGAIDGRVYYYGTQEFDDDLLGLRVRYDFGDAGMLANAFAFGNVQTFTEAPVDATSYLIGGGYKVNDLFSLEAGLGQYREDGESLNMVSFGLAYEMGEKIRIDQRVDHAQRQDMFEGVAAFRNFGF